MRQTRSLRANARPASALQLRVPASCRPKQARERNEITESIEEYTEGIYRLQEEMEIVGTGDIAQYMNVAPASVTTMLKKLVELSLAEHMPYQGVRLTAKGEAISVSLLRKHRLIERLLVDFLELPWDDVHDLACKLEHYLSEEVTDKISKALGHPTTCPHGNPINARESDDAIRLSECEAGDALEVARISDERLEFLSYVLQIGILPGTPLCIIDKTPFGDVLMLRIKGQNDVIPVGRDVAGSIWTHVRAKTPEK